MKISIVSKPKRTGPTGSKYENMLRAMKESLEQDGADGKLRLFNMTSKWDIKTLRRWTVCLRTRSYHYPIKGFRLAINIKEGEGLMFRWVKVEVPQTVAEAKKEATVSIVSTPEHSYSC